MKMLKRIEYRSRFKQLLYDVHKFFFLFFSSFSLLSFLPSSPLLFPSLFYLELATKHLLVQMYEDLAIETTKNPVGWGWVWTRNSFGYVTETGTWNQKIFRTVKTFRVTQKFSVLPSFVRLHNKPPDHTLIIKKLQRQLVRLLFVP